MEKPQTLEFQAEARQVLDLMIHSLYTHREIFLRELISNASDALDRLRVASLTEPNLLGRDERFEIVIEVDTKARTLAVHDSGIGMSRDEVISNIGTIAKSGTREVLASLRESNNADVASRLIGQFGVGFYSAFMVADKVSLLTRRAGESQATLWESTGDGTYTVSDADKFSRGTSITLHLKPADADAETAEEGGLEDFTAEWVVNRIVRQYSDFVAYPITFKKAASGTDTKEVLADTRPINSMKPIWARPASEVSDEEFQEFYKHVSHDWNPPLRHFSFRAEGRIEYQALVYLPSEPPMDMFFDTGKFGLHLYVRHVLIMETCEDLLPRYLRFVRGMVDSADLPLNISRQRLQEDRHIAQIRKWVARKIIDALADMARTEPDVFAKFWDHFGRVLKEGVAFDFENKDRLVPLLRFRSSSQGETLSTLSEYVSRMGPEQKAIYYITGDSLETISRSPHLEALEARGLEVLLLTDAVDELVVQALDKFGDHDLKSASKGTVALGGEDEQNETRKDLNAKQVEYLDLLTRLKGKLSAHVKEVRLTNRLTRSPACLVVSDADMSPQLARILRAQRGTAPETLRILELNPGHAIVRKLRERVAANASDPLVDDYAELLYGGALIAEGSELEDPSRFNEALARLMEENL
jgi:molecular chaperone HtpG